MFLKEFSLRVLVRLLFMTLLLFVAFSCSRPQERVVIPSVFVFPVISTEIPHVTTAVGQVVPKEDVQIIARVEGFLIKRLFESGEYVTKGQLLFQIQKEQYIAQLNDAKAAVIEAQAQYDNALIEYHRQKNLYSANATSQKDYDNSIQSKSVNEGKLLAAKANLELQSLNLSYTDLYSPFDGRVGMYNYSVGNVVGENSNSLTNVIMVDPIWIEFPISETYLADMMKTKQVLPTKKNGKVVVDGVIVKAILSDGVEYPILGNIDYISNKIDPLTGTIQMRAVFRNPEEKLVPGGYVTVKLESVKKNHSLLIFQSSMLVDQLGTFVYTVSKDNIVHKQYIKKGATIDTQIVVENGLEEGEMVIVGGVLRVRPGIKVNCTLANKNINF
jgi:membrane fusion protein (multidrug efflux system)